MRTLNRSATLKTYGSAFALVLLMSTSSQAQDVLVPTSNLSPELALEIAQTSLRACQAEGYQVSVAVVDRMGVPQVMLRDRYAGPHTPDTAQRKAWTAVSFRTDTLALANNTKADAAHETLIEINVSKEMGDALKKHAGSRVKAVTT